METLALGPGRNIPQLVKGVGFDVAAYDAGSPPAPTPAYKIDVDTMMTVDSYDGLTEPYTYSDLTGSALRNFDGVARR